jgi:hypothetical protein
MFWLVDVQLHFLPECEPTTGSDGLLKFKYRYKHSYLVVFYVYFL